MQPPYIRIARVVKPFGTSGFFLIEATGIASLAPVAPGLEVCIVPPTNSLPRWCLVEEIAHESATIAKMKLAGIETRNDVQSILNHELLVEETSEFARVASAGNPNSRVADKDLLYASKDLCGFTVFDKELGKIGEITAVSTNGAHALWEIESAARSFLFPAVDAYIVELNSSKREAHVTLPEGLLDAEAK